MAGQLQLLRGITADVAAYVGPIGEIVVDTTTFALYLQDGVTPGGWLVGGGEVPYAYSAPTTGATVTTSANERRRIIDPAGTIAAMSLVLPPTPANGHLWEGSTSHAISALTVTAPGGASVNGGSFLAPANSGFSWIYRAANTTWYRMS